MADRYQEIRDALAMGPTPGPYRQSEHTPQRVDTGDGAINIGWACNVDNGARESRAEATAALIAACDPDTIRALLAERDRLLDAAQVALAWSDPDWVGYETVKSAVDAALAQGKGGR